MAVEFAVTVVTGSLAGVGEEPEQKETQHLIEQLVMKPKIQIKAHYLARRCPSTAQ